MYLYYIIFYQTCLYGEGLRIQGVAGPTQSEVVARVNIRQEHLNNIAAKTRTG